MKIQLKVSVLNPCRCHSVLSSTECVEFVLRGELDELKTSHEVAHENMQKRLKYVN